MAIKTIRFNVFGRLLVDVERIGDSWRVLEVGSDGKRGVRGDLAVPDELTEDEIAGYLGDILHELAKPGGRVVRVFHSTKHSVEIQR